MKSITIKLSLVALIVFSSTSCSKRIDDAYLNPNTYVRVPPEELLPQIISSMAANYAGHGTMNDIRYFGAYIQNWQYYATLSNFDRMGYVNTAADVAQSIWRMHYYDIGQNNMKMIQWAAEEKKWDYVGAGKAIFAWSWLNLTDIYGEVILKEAFNTDLITFQYDTQPEVYEYVKQLCFEALENLNKTGDAVGNLGVGDAYFLNGDVNKWKKFTYGILARVYNRYSNKGAAYKPDSVIHYANLAMTSVTENASVKFEANTLGATNNFFGPYRGNLASASTATPSAIRQGAFIADLMSGANDTAFTLVEDPRAIYLLRLNTNNTFKGVTPNKGQTALTANDRPENFWGVPQIVASNAAPSNDNNCRFIFRNSAPFPIMTAAEMKFLKAEAAFKKGDKATALIAYKEGIALHFDMLTTQYNQNIPTGKEITPAVKAEFLDPILNPKVIPGDPSGLTLRHIMLQKYIAMFGFGVLETWVDMRRYHYTDLDPEQVGQVYAGFKPPSGTDLFPDNGGKLIYRYYPRFNSEYVWNRNELERIGATVANYHTKPTWFAE
jgi:hypothetical protein